MPDALPRSHERQRVDRSRSCERQQVDIPRSCERQRVGVFRNCERQPAARQPFAHPRSHAPAALALLLLLAPGSFLLGATPAAEPSAQAFNWVLPIFTDAEGYRSLTARGTEVRPQGRDAIEVVDLSLTVFSGDAAARVETVLLSPIATFVPKENRASGDKGLRVIRDDLEASGTRWSYAHARKHVTLEGDVRIVFNAEIDDLLK